MNLEDLSTKVVAVPKQHKKKPSQQKFNNTIKAKASMVQITDKEDIMNLDIELIWREMEVIGRSKKAAH